MRMLEDGNPAELVKRLEAFSSRQQMK